MENISISQTLNQKIKVFNFFAFVFFGGLAALFLYYKTLGGIGFAMSTGFFEVMPGAINVGLGVAAVGIAFLLKQKEINVSKPLLLVVGLSILGFMLNQLLIWVSKFNEGMFVGGDVLKTYGVDDIVYFTLYYFITFFQIVFAMIVGVSYIITFIKGENSGTYLNSVSLFSILKPLFFSVICVFIFYHLWN